MKNNHTDLTFFTNEPGSNLLDRYRRTLQDTQYFDSLGEIEEVKLIREALK